MESDETNKRTNGWTAEKERENGLRINDITSCSYIDYVDNDFMNGVFPVVLVRSRAIRLSWREKNITEPNNKM